ncbi:MAG: ATP-binding protein [Myxococcota bacterium]
MSERAQETGEIEFQRLLEKLPAAAYTCDVDGLITYFNPRAAELWGREPMLNDAADRFCGSFKLASTDGTPIRHDQCWMALALREDREYNGLEIVVERPDGQRVTALAHANPIHDATGSLSGAVNVLVDISERRRVEDVLREADRAKDEFLATLAHELRNPLAPLRHVVELLRTPVLPDLQWAVDVIDRQTRHMARLIDDLLEVSRVSHRKLELRRQRVELTEIVRAAVETSRPLLEVAGHELGVTLPTSPTLLDADPTRVAQALSNLLNNAAKYTARGGRVWLTAERQGRDAVVTVGDTGIGIPAEMIPRIFEMFTQGEQSVESAQEGLGIGLTLAKQLIEMHGGTLQVRSDGPGKGAEFTVRLPTATTTAPEPERPSSEDKSAARPTVRILVVDDNRDSVESLSLLLETLGNEVRTAHDGLEAVKLAKEQQPELVLLDLGLPGLNGYDVAREIRRLPWSKGTVLVALTGWGQEEDRRRTAEAGFDHHLGKPVDTLRLRSILGSIGRGG